MENTQQHKNLHIWEIDKPQWLLDIESLPTPTLPRKIWNAVVGFPSTIECGIRSVVYWVRNLWDFRYILWKYRHWDYEWILRFLVRILEIHRDRLEADNLVVETPQIVEQINTFIGLVEKWENSSEDYETSQQHFIQSIANTPDKELRNTLYKKYYEGLGAFEKHNWEAMFKHLSTYMGEWWN